MAQVIKVQDGKIVYSAPPDSLGATQYIDFIVNGKIYVTDPTDNALIPDSGALQVVGGASVNKNLYVGSGLKVIGNGIINGTLNVVSDFSVNTNKFTVASSTGDTSIAGILNDTNTTNSTSTSTGAIVTSGGLGVTKNAYIGGSTNIAGVLTDTSGTLSTSTSTGAVVISGTGGLGVGGAVNIGGNTNIAGILTDTNTTNSTSTTTGAIVTSGGLGVAKDVYIGGNTSLSGTLSTSGAMHITDTTSSTSTGTGALTVSGGVGIGENLNVGGNTILTGTLTANSTVQLSPNNSNVTISPTGTGTLTINPATTGTINNVNIGTSTRGSGAFTTLTSNGSTTFTAGTASSSTTTGTVVVTGGVGISGATNIGGILTDTNTTNSTSTSTGAIVTSGGLGVAQDVYIGGSTHIAGILTDTNTTNSTSTTTGAIVTSGGLGVAGNTYIGGNTNVGGTLTVTGSVTFLSPVAADLNMGTYKITNLGEPTSSQDATTKNYVDNVAAGVQIHASCDTATTTVLATCTYNNGASGVGATLTANLNGAIGSIGGYGGLYVNARILVKNQSSSLQNGIYVVTSLGSVSTPWILTRATDFDGSPTQEVGPGDLTYIQSGILIGTQWVETALGTGTNKTIVIGTDALTFTQFSGPGTYLPGSGIDISSNTISNTGVITLLGTTNQISVAATVPAATGSYTVSLPSTISGLSSVTSTAFTSTQLTGTAPFTVASTTKVTNLNVDLLDGLDSSQFLRSDANTNFTSGTVTFNSGTTVNFNNVTGTAPFNVTSTTLVANLNADLLDGLTSSQFLRSDVSTAYTAGTLTFNSGTIQTHAAGATVNFNNTTGTAPFIVASTTPVTNLHIDAANLTGTTLASNVVSSSLTSVGTITAGVWNGTAIANANLANSSLTVNGVAISLGGSGTVTAAAGTLTGATLNATVTASSLTSVGTLGSLAVTGAITGSSFNSITGLSSTTPAALGTAAVGTGTTAARADHVHQSPTTISGQAGSVANSLTINNIGAGSVSGSTYNGSAAVTISYNSIGASPLAGSSSLTTTGTVTSGTWSSSFGAVSGANLTSLTGANVTGTVPAATTATNFNNGNARSSAGQVYVDTLESVVSTDWLELCYTSGVGVRVGTGVNGSLPLYAGSLYDAGNRVYSAANPQVNISGNSVTTSQRTFSNVRTDGINRGSYGSISVTGSTGGYGGIDLTDQAATWMTNITGGVSFGVYKSNTAWAFYFDASGNLTVGTVPGASVTGTVANATLATKASTLAQGGGTGAAMTFNWSGQAGQPSWLWGSNDGTNIYVYNPSNFNVNSATIASTVTINSYTGAGSYPIVWNSGNTLYSNAGVNITPSTNTINASTINATSTKRVKTAIADLNNTYIEKFMNLRPREFDRTDYVAHEFGFIAEEMELVYPEVVGKDEKGMPTGIDYSKLTTILTAKVQEQQNVIDKLQEQMKNVMILLKELTK